jgi:aryl carrier-like protein
VARMGEERKVCTRFWWESPKERDHLEDQGVRIDLREIGLGRGVDWIRLVQYRDRWRAVVSAVMNLRVLAPRS